jgi:hypothetical protein
MDPTVPRLGILRPRLTAPVVAVVLPLRPEDFDGKTRRTAHEGAVLKEFKADHGAEELAG